ncbi:DNA-binding transcriptional regulator, MarR family [Paenibacillus sp. 1_12]|uniref:MarR family winged helix-turn-helix transcriptional regulator n=1 Tax=Paenibacillus sp. 1_12 TaxID=1566278 RepID=UPI0008E5F41E|nr:MarR family transcriptional regulator [Paenibacillus sp. 1_12]SFL94321.1 DNA-binding transcriptional regulator, MarR family [Paenibacillus sp. 1_12]
MDKNAVFQKFVAFTAAVHQISNEMTKDVKSETITTVQYKILEYIAVSQPSTLSDISECMHMSMPNTSRELRKLSEKGLCEKITDADDRRKQFIRLSARGDAMMNEVFEQIESRFVERLRDISEEELGEIEQALDLLHTKVFY